MISIERRASPTALSFIACLSRPPSKPLPSSHSQRRPRSTSNSRPFPQTRVSAPQLQFSKPLPSDKPLPSNESRPLDTGGIRVNKCFKSFASRRQSDYFVEQGRVKINGKVAASGTRVHPGDVVELDDNVIEWQRLTLDVKTQDFIYIKHWKRPGVICTTDPEIPSNIISQIPPIPQQSSDRIFPIGRLDDASSGLILLTSDGRLPNAVLGASKRCAKKYLVVPDMRVSDEDVEHLRGGVAITTVTRRDGFVHRPRTARTLPCEVERGEGFELFITLFEGRNRQIRKMLGALGYTTRDIHRVEFMGIGLDGLESPGDVCVLNDAEMEMINRKLNEVAS